MARGDTPGGTDCVDRRVCCFVVTTVRQRDGGTLGGERRCDAASDSPATTGHECDAACELHRSSFSTVPVARARVR